MLQCEVFIRLSAAWICETTAAPSPTAAATRLVDPALTSPMAKTFGRLVSSGSGLREKLQSASNDWPVTIKPFSLV
jgi:hypothetical protein